MTDDRIREVAELLEDPELAVLTTHDPSGTATSRPMALQDVEFDGDLWFFAERGSPKVAAWLPQGPDGDSVVLFRVDARSAEYWDTPGRVATPLCFVKARATRERYSGGEDERVEL